MTDAELLIRAIREIVAEELQRALERALVELREERAEAEREWMDVRETARWLGWSDKRVRNESAAGRLPVTRAGRRVLYHKPTICNWLLD